ncbi:MAG TPA: fasciclin domain-containing protein [Xanthomonadales bacterium]|nr:fasciclin domain-containing protein [Xanthomonadales bacterium]
MNPVNNSGGTASTRNLLDTAAALGTFTRFTEAVEKAGLSETLRGAGPYTVFAPTDTAFANLPAGRLDALYLPENKAELAALLNYHIVDGRRSAADVGKWDAARTINGQPAPILLSGDEVRIDGAQLVSLDIASSNGVIHGIDKVNIPTPTKH